MYFKKVKTTSVSYRLGLAMDSIKMDGLTLSVKSGVSASSISCYLNSRSEPTRRTATRLALVLGVTADWLLGIVPLDTCLAGSVDSSVDDLVNVYKQLSEKNMFRLMDFAILLQLAQSVDETAQKANA